MPDPIKDYLSSIGRRGGQSTSEAKKAASRINGAKNKKPTVDNISTNPKDGVQ